MNKLAYLSLGGGLQSSTIVEMIVEKELPLVKAAIFADTLDEPGYVYEQIKYLEKRLETVDIPLVVVNNGDIYKDTISGVKRVPSIPVFTEGDEKTGRMMRQCTYEYKIVPIEKWIRNDLLGMGLAKKNKVGSIYINRGIKIEMGIGFSLDEALRMKPNKHAWVENRWPLIDLRMSKLDCKNWLEKKGLPIPMKSSCRICPYHNDRFWRYIKDNMVSDWEDVVSFDNKLRTSSSWFLDRANKKLYLHKSCLPMDKVNLETQQERGQLGMFDECDEGYCFV